MFKMKSGEINQEKQPKNLTRETLFESNLVKGGLRNVASHHVESFNFAMETCLQRINQYMKTAEVVPQAAGDDAEFPFKKMTMWFEDFELKMPEKLDSRGGAIGGSSDAAFSLFQGEKDKADVDILGKMYPYECRLRSLTYSAPLYATVARKMDNEEKVNVTLCLGHIPVMVRSKFCNLHNLTEEQLIHRKEDCFEFGGYFIVNGNERIIRMLI